MFTNAIPKRVQSYRNSGRGTVGAVLALPELF